MASEQDDVGDIEKKETRDETLAPRWSSRRKTSQEREREREEEEVAKSTGKDTED